ncbi:AAA family ATPase [Polaromonas sp.]|nr:AAA family ATPase [Candidatus Saccharibacteria bacterium]
MTNLAVHAVTAQQLKSFVTHPSHAVLLHGPAGAGKTALAYEMAAQVLNRPDISNYPYVLAIDAPTVSSEAAETVRTLEHFLSLRVPTPGTINRIVIINDAHSLSLAAQNSLLKTIEEPPQGTLLILTAVSLSSVLPTISSRAQSIAVHRPAKATLATHFATLQHESTAIDQAYAMSGGLPGLMAALLSNSDHPLKPATAMARALLQASLFDRLVAIEDLSKQRAQALNVLFILQQMAHARLQATTDTQFNRWQQILQASYMASEQLLGSAQPKLVLDSLMLKLN